MCHSFRTRVSQIGFVDLAASMILLGATPEVSWQSR